MKTTPRENSELEQYVTTASEMCQPARTSADRGVGFANWQPAVSNCDAARVIRLQRLGNASVMFMTLILSLIMFVAPARADRIAFQISLAGPANVETTRIAGAEIAVETRSIGSTVLYRLINKGTDWSGRVVVSIAKAGESKPAIARSLLLKSGQIATFRVKTSVPHPALELRLSPEWSSESHVHVFRHNASQNVLASLAGGVTNRGVVRRESFYIQ